MPAAVMTYTTLVSDIKTYSERPNDAELAAQIPRIILMAESECASDVKILGTELVAHSEVFQGQNTFEKPTYWRETVSFSLIAPVRKQLLKRTLEYVRNYWPDASLESEPVYYAEYDYNNFLIAPTPDQDYDFELIYYARLNPLTDTNETNWMSVNAPQLLLFKCMYHAQLFLKNYDKADWWQAQYANALASLKLEDTDRKSDRTTFRKS